VNARIFQRLLRKMEGEKRDFWEYQWTPSVH